MNKLTMPAILVATVMVAGVFAFMPVEQASTVHTTIQGAGGTSLDDVLAASMITEVEAVSVTDSNTGDIVTLACTEDYILMGLTADYAVIDIDDDLLIEADGVDVLTREGDDGEMQIDGVALIFAPIGALAAEAITITFTDADNGGDEDVDLTATVLVAEDGTCTFTQTTDV